MGWIYGNAIQRNKLRIIRTLLLAVAALASLWPLRSSFAQEKQVVWSAAEKPIADQIHGLRALPDDVRAGTTKDLALRIRNLPASENKLRLAVGLANLSTEGDFGHDALQEVATTLAVALRDHPLPWPEPKDAKDPDEKASASQASRAIPREPASPYVELASLVRYEQVTVPPDFRQDEQFRAALARLESDDHKRQHAQFALKDLTGKTWTFAELRGKVVLVNFWATWCPPCRKEMPDLEALYERYGPRGLVILGISDEKAEKVEPFIRDRKITFPLLLDPKRKVNEMFVVEGIPKSFVYDREGKLVAQSIDMRTRRQFLEMLAKAGLGETQK